MNTLVTTDNTDKTLQTIPLEPAVQSLVEDINNEIEEGKERAVRAMEKEKRLIYWNIGKRIKEHLLENEARADYGTYLFKSLVENISLDRTTLYRCVKFYEEYPEIVARGPQLTWSHIRILIAIPETAKREQYESIIIEKNLTASELRVLIKTDTLGEQALLPAPTLSTSRGFPWLYQLKERDGVIEVDLGFKVRTTCPDQSLSIDHVYEVQKHGPEYKLHKITDNTKPYYIYLAKVLEVVDGDTLWVDVDLGFKIKVDVKIRLKGINTPPLDTPEGLAAQQFIIKKLKGCKFIAIKTYWRDKFARSIADIFYNDQSLGLNSLIQNGKFLNQELLDEGLAA